MASSSHRKDLNEAMKKKGEDLGVDSTDPAAFDEEHERELSPQAKPERKFETSGKIQPLKFELHRDVKRFTEEGILNLGSDAFSPAFDIFKATTAKNLYKTEDWAPQVLLATTGYINTVKAAGNMVLDQYLKPCEWIAVREDNGYIRCVVMSSDEVNELLSSIQKLKKVDIYRFSPRNRPSMPALADLSFPISRGAVNTPVDPLLVMQINLFAGSLYIKDREEYIRLCRFLGLCFYQPPSHVKVNADGFVDPKSRQKYDRTMAEVCPFSTSPVEFLKAVITMRRKGDDITSTHLGRLLRGDALYKGVFPIA